MAVIEFIVKRLHCVRGAEGVYDLYGVGGVINGQTLGSTPSLWLLSVAGYGRLSFLLSKTVSRSRLIEKENTVSDKTTTPTQPTQFREDRTRSDSGRQRVSTSCQQ